MLFKNSFQKPYETNMNIILKTCFKLDSLNDLSFYLS